MADTAAEHEADSGTGGPIQAPPDGTQDDESEHNDVDRVTASNTNYDSGDGNHRCDRCDFEAVNRVALTTHINSVHNCTENEVGMEVIKILFLFIYCSKQEANKRVTYLHTDYKNTVMELEVQHFTFLPLYVL